MYRRYRFVGWMVVVFLTASFVTRLILTAVSLDELDQTPRVLLKTFGAGLLNDIVTATYYVIPLMIYMALVPIRWYQSRIHRMILVAIAVTMTFVAVFNGVSEYFFWDEFGKRFNFIAVDYLVYTHEVIRNIEESYPVKTLLVTAFVVSAAIVYALRKALFAQDDTTPLRTRFVITGLWMVLLLTAFTFIDKQPLARVSSNVFNNELAKNGTYALFSAFRHNELDYDTFFKTLPLKKVMVRLKIMEGFDDITPKRVRFKQPPIRKNIVLIMVESLSAEYLGVFGNTEGWTPNLDALAKRSLFFDNLFATGTRTVRGMEAVTLSVPPTPGRSIVKRPVNDVLDSVGKVLRHEGYANTFIYAGHGYFDNMNDFFSKNGFEVIDRTDFDDKEIHFANVWGVCDEDLYAKTLKEADKAYRDKRPFFFYVMTTSNHRPYTYPKGRIDIPSHTGRGGAVKYADYALGEFLKEAKRKPWFKDTVFVIVADHNGGSAGKTSLPLYRYRIPLFIYAPGFIEPARIGKLASQIDVMPTVLALLHIGYDARFYGNDILNDRFKQRAFIGNYQKLGYVKNGYLYYLTPDKQVHKKRIDALGLHSVRYRNADANVSEQEIEEIVTYYQSAAYFYHKGVERKKDAQP